MAHDETPKFTRKTKPRASEVEKPIKPKKKRGAPAGKGRRTSSAGLFKPDARKGKDPIIPDLFDRTPATDPTRSSIVAEDVGGKEKWAHDTSLLKIEWAIKFPLLTPRIFLIEKKGYSSSQADTIIGTSGGAIEWQSERGKILDKMTETTVMRHIDQMAEVQETHVKASKVGLAKAIEMLSRLSVDPAKDKDGKIIKDGDGKIVWKGFRSIDLLNVMSAIEKAQQIYRRSMGLPNDEGGMAQILEKVALIQNNTQIIVHEGDRPVVEKSEKEKAIDELSYDDIMEFVEFRREQKKAQAEEPEKAKGSA